MRRSLALVWVLGFWLAGCSPGGVQPLAPVTSGAVVGADAGKDPSASDYSAHLDLLALGYDDGSFEVRSPAPQHVLSRGQHAWAIVNVAVSFDGQRLATADSEGVLAVSETDSGELTMLPSVEVVGVTPIGLAWDHTGKRLAVANSSMVRVMQVDGDIAKQVKLDDSVSAVAFSADDRELILGGRRLTFLSLPDLKETHRLALPAEHTHVLDVRVSPDANTLGVLFDFGAALFDLRNQHVEAELVQDLKPVGLRFASDGRIALFSRKALYVGPAKAESVKQGLRGTGGMLWDVEFRRDDSLLVFGKGVDADVEALLQ